MSSRQAPGAQATTRKGEPCSCASCTVPPPTRAMPACLSCLPAVHVIRMCRRRLAYALKMQCLRSHLNGEKQSSKAGGAHELLSKASSKAKPRQTAQEQAGGDQEDDGNMKPLKGEPV